MDIMRKPAWGVVCALTVLALVGCAEEQPHAPAAVAPAASPAKTSAALLEVLGGPVDQPDLQAYVTSLGRRLDGDSPDTLRAGSIRSAERLCRARRRGRALRGSAGRPAPGASAGGGAGTRNRARSRRPRRGDAGSAPMRTLAGPPRGTAASGATLHPRPGTPGRHDRTASAGPCGDRSARVGRGPHRPAAASAALPDGRAISAWHAPADDGPHPSHSSVDGCPGPGPIGRATRAHTKAVPRDAAPADPLAELGRRPHTKNRFAGLARLGDQNRQLTCAPT